MEDLTEGRVVEGVLSGAGENDCSVRVESGEAG
jgi:hypothetical protein